MISLFLNIFNLKKSPEGTRWISIRCETTSQRNRDLIWHMGMFFFLNRSVDLAVSSERSKRIESDQQYQTAHQWEVDRAAGKAANLQRQFRDSWLSLGNRIT